MFEFDRSVAIVIGINNYQNGISPLQTARYDAEYLADVLKSSYGYEVEPLLDDKATSDAIWTRLESVKKHIKPDERVQLLFYFAGHGTPPSDEAGEAGYLVPQNGHPGDLDSFLSMRKIHEILVEMKCHHLLIILDCCFAGAFRFNTRHIGAAPEELSKERYDRYTEYRAAQVIASAAHDQKAIDIVVDNRGTSKDPEFANHSPFAAALLKALKYQAADYTKDGITTATELFLYVSEEVLAQTYDSRNPQVPRFWPLQDHDKGECIFRTGEFNYDRLPTAPELNEQNNPYRGLEAFDEAHSKYFFGREELIKELFNRIAKDEHSQNGEDKRENSPYPSLTVVLGVSGSGKSSLVKAGLIPYLRQHDAERWHILDPVRLGNTPFDSLAKTMLASEEKLLADEITVLDELYKALRKARKQSPFDKALGRLVSEWSQATPEGRLLLVIRHFNQMQSFCHQSVSLDQLEQLRQLGLSRSRLVLENIEFLQKECRPEERSGLDRFHQQCLESIKIWKRDWQSDPAGFGRFIAKWCQNHPQTKLLLIVDQFEEFITLCRPEERTPFLELLKSGLEACPQQLRMVLTLRADFEPRFIESEQLQGYWKDARFPMRPMRSHELRQAIEKPAMEQVLYFEPADFVDRLIEEVGQMPGTLPLLSFTLSELYRESLRQDRKDRALREEDYNNKLGGVAGSLTRRATEEYNKLDDDHKITMRHIMLRMLTLESGEVARRRVLRSELDYSNSETGERIKKNAQVEEIIQRLVDARLLTRGEQDGKDYEGRDYIEPAHDLLLRGWELIQEWIEQYQEDIALQQRLVTAAKDWNLGKGEGKLWLEEADRLVKLEKVLEAGKENWLNKVEVEFVTQSLQVRLDRIQKLEEDLRISEERRARAELREKVFRIENLLSVRPLDGLILAIATIGQNLEELPDEILSSVQSSLRKAMNVACERDSFKAHDGIIDYVDFSPESKQVISRSYSFRQKPSNSYIDNLMEQMPIGGIEPTQVKHDEVVRLWNEQGSCTSELLKDDDHKFLSFTSDGQEIVTVDSTGFLHLWSLDGKSNDKFFVGNIDLSPSINSTTTSSSSRQHLVLGNDDGTVNLWELPPEESLANKLSFLSFHAHQTSISAINLSSDGQIVATGSVDGMIGVWNLNGSPVIDQISGHKGRVLAITTSSDNRRIISGSDDGTVCIWDVRNKKYELFQISESAISSVALSFDGQHFAAGTSDGIVYVRSVQGKLIATLKVGHKRNLFVAFNSLEGTEERLKSKNPLLDLVFVILAGWADNLVVRTVQGINPLKRISGFRKRRIVVGSSDGTIQVWDLQGNPVGKSFTGCTSRLSIGFSPDKRQIVALSHRKLRSWDLQGNLIDNAFENHRDGVLSAAFSPDRQMIVSGSADSTVCLWDGWGNLINQLLKGNEYAPIPYQGFVPGVESLGVRDLEAFSFKNRVHTVNFSSDGERIVSGSYNGTVHIWDAKTDLIRSFELLEAKVSSVTFGADDQVIASSTDGRIYTWTLEGSLIHKTMLDLPSDLSYREELAMAFNLAEQRIVAGGRQWVCLCSMEGEIINSPLKYPSGAFGPSDTLSIASSPDGNWIVCGSSDDIAYLWNLRDTSTVKILHGYKGDALAFNSDSQSIAGSSYGNTIRLWSINGDPAGKPLQGQKSMISAITFGPNGRIIGGDENGALHVWDSEGKQIGEPFSGHTGKVSSVAISSNGKWIVSGSDDKTVRLWDLDGNPIGEPLRGHQDSISSVAFSADGQMIVSGGRDRTVRLWRVGTWENWLRVCCNRIRYHSSFRNPNLIENLEQREIAIEACETCHKYVWEE